MDPDAALAEIRRLIAALLAQDAEATREAELGQPESDEWFAPGLVSELLDVVIGLDKWLSKGGFLPTAWSRVRSKSVPC